MMDNLNGFQKLVSTWRTFSISIGLDCRDPQPYFYVFYVFYVLYVLFVLYVLYV